MNLKYHSYLRYFISINLIALIFMFPSFCQSNFVKIEKTDLKIGNFDKWTIHTVEPIISKKSYLIKSNYGGYLSSYTTISEDLKKKIGTIKTEIDHSYYFNEDNTLLFKIKHTGGIEYEFGTLYDSDEYYKITNQKALVEEIELPSCKVKRKFYVDNIIGEKANYQITSDNRYLILSYSYHNAERFGEYYDNKVIKLYIIDLNTGKTIKDYRLDLMSAEIVLPAKDFKIINDSLYFKTEKEIYRSNMSIEDTEHGYNYYRLNINDNKLEKLKSASPMREYYGLVEDIELDMYGGLFYFDYLKRNVKLMSKTINGIRYLNTGYAYLNNNKSIALFQSKYVVFFDKKSGSAIKYIGNNYTRPINDVFKSRFQLTTSYFGTTGTKDGDKYLNGVTDLKVFDNKDYKFVESINIYKNQISTVSKINSSNRELISITNGNPRIAKITCLEPIDYNYKKMVNFGTFRNLKYYKTPEKFALLDLNELRNIKIDSEYLNQYENIGRIKIVYSIKEDDIDANWEVTDQNLITNLKILEESNCMSNVMELDSDVNIFKLKNYNVLNVFKNVKKISIDGGVNGITIKGSDSVEKLLLYDAHGGKIELPNLKSLYMYSVNFDQSSLDLSKLKYLSTVYSENSTFELPIKFSNEARYNIIAFEINSVSNAEKYKFDLSSLTEIKSANNIEIYYENVKNKNSLSLLHDIKLLNLICLSADERKAYDDILASKHIKLYTSSYFLSTNLKIFRLI